MVTASISDSVYVRIGKRLNIDPAAIKAVATVESAGRGMLADGRPAILFEAHIFSGQTGHRYDQSHPDISSPVWNRALYKGGAAEWPRLERARALNEEAANASASWGIFQIMGFNYRACGFLSATQYANAMMTGPAAHVEAFANFIAANKPMLNALRAKDWATFARLYNGPGQVPYYSTKISEAYNSFAGTLVDNDPAPVGLFDSGPAPVQTPPADDAGDDTSVTDGPDPSKDGPPIPYVDTSTPAKSVAKSRTVWGGVGAGVAITGTIADSVMPYLDSAVAMKSSLGALIGFKYLPIAMGVVALGLIGWMIYRYIRKARAGDVIVR